MDKKDMFFLGTGLGLALGYFLNSNKGKQVRTQAANYISSQATELKTEASGIIDKATEVAANLKNKGNEYLKEMNEEAIGQKDVEAFVEKKISKLKDQVLEQVEEYSASSNHQSV